MREIKTADLLKILPFIIIIVILMIAPFFLGLYHLSILRSIFLWSALAMSWWFFSGVTRYVSLGSAAFFGISLYLVAILGNFIPFPVVILITGLFCFIIALGIGLVTLRLKGIYFAVFTFGLAELFHNLVQWYEITITGTRFRFIFYLPAQQIYWAVLIGSLIILGLIFYIMRTRLGLALRLIGENEEAAAHLGVNVSLYKTLGFAISAMFIGLITACYAPRFPFIDPTIAFNPLYSLQPAIMAMLGGVAFLYGPVLGVIIVQLLNEGLRLVAIQYFLILLGVIVIIIVLFMPDGIAGIIEKARAIYRQKGIAGIIEHLKDGVAGFIERVKNVFSFGGSKEQIKAPETPP